MDDNQLAKTVVQKMYDNDPFSQWLGIEILEAKPGSSRLRMTVRQEMLNGFGVCHGGIAFSLADSALAFASNSHGRVAVSVEAGMAYPNPVRIDDVLTAQAEEISVGDKIATYQVSVKKADQSVVGIFRGTVYRTLKEHILEQKKELA